MSLPKSVVKFSKSGVTYTSSVDKASYLITELTRAALRDVGRYISRTANSAAMKLPGMAKSKRVRGKTSAFQYWVRKKEGDLQVGIKHDTWYGVAQELGSATRVGKGGKGIATQPKKGVLRNSVYDNIPTIVEIESKYLSALESEAEALNKIDEGEYQGGGEDD